MPTLDDYTIQNYVKVPLSKIHPDDQNLRQHFTLKEITNLAKSLAERGQIQPGVAELKDGEYHLVTGNRRYYAAEMAFNRGWTKVDYLLLKVTNPLPEKLRFAVQKDENGGKERVPPPRMAESVWGKYVLTLAPRVEDFAIREKVYTAEDYQAIKELGVSQLLPIREFAKSIGRDPKTTKNYFSFQQLHEEIQRNVHSGKIKFKAACRLSSISNKNDQRVVLSMVKSKGDVTSRRVGAYVQDYHRISKEDLFSPVKLQNGRTGKLVELSNHIGEAEEFVNFLETIVGFDPSMLDLSARVGGRETTPRIILKEYHKQVQEAHQKLLGLDLYKKRWEHSQQHRRTTLADFISKKVSSKAGEEEVIMGKAEYVNVDLTKEEVSPNPQNPRGKREDYDKEGLERLTESVKKVGIIQPLVLMRTKEKGYMILEGHRRYYAAKMAGLTKFGALILPELTKEQQLLVMYDSDIFEEFNMHDLLTSVAIQYQMEKRENPAIDISDFCKQQKTLTPQKVRDAIAYSSLLPEVRELCQKGLLSYRVGILMGGMEDKSAQKIVAESAAVLKQSEKDINQMLREEQTQGTLWSREELDGMRRDGQKKLVVRNLEEKLLGVCSRLAESTFSGEDAKRLVQDYYLSHKFQKFFSTLENAVQNAVQAA